MKEKLVVIGANDFQNCLILKAKDLGYETHVFAWKCGDIGEGSADFFYPISIIDKERILAECRKIQPAAILSIGSDLAVLTVNYVARELGLTANSAYCDSVATNKYEMRSTLLQAGIPTPHFIKVLEDNISEACNLHYPVIIKPTDRSGSRGITKIDTKEGLQEAIRKAINQSFENAAIIEEFIEGKEYSCECISFKGKHDLLAFTEKFTTGAPNFIEIGHIQPATIEEGEKEVLKSIIFRALDALGIKNGASHTEFKIDQQGNIGIIEIGARMGGDCIGSDLVFLSTGNDFMKMVIDVACGKKPEIADNMTGIFAAIRFIMKENDMKLLEISREQLTVERVSEISREFLDEVKDSSSRYGYILVTAEKKKSLEETLFRMKL